jgi:hypothetical protein
MKSDSSRIFHHLKGKVIHKYILFTSLIFFFLSWIFTSLHYTNIYYGNNLSWITWLTAIATFLLSFCPRNISFKKMFAKISKTDIWLAIFMAILFWATHLWNFSSAPWNQNGLFDDAAWDIFFAKNHAFIAPFQAAFFDNVGYISREVVFHYYITVFFKIFGYNLLVFNISLLCLGFITVFFTTLIIHKLLKNNIVTILSALVINFFPLHFMHIFMGHRYAIAAPLMVISLYFLYSSFKDKSPLKAIISAIFASLCWASAIMGKQYLLGLGLSLLLIVVFERKIWRQTDTIVVGLIWLLVFIISSTPLITYIVFNYDLYILREQNLSSQFFKLFNTGGLGALKPYFNQLNELFFAKLTYERQFLSDYYIIPLYYYFLLIPGLVIASVKKRFEIVFLSFISTIGALVSGSYDFRVLLSVPLWVICTAYSLNFVFKLKNHPRLSTGNILRIVSLVLVTAGIFSSINYLWNVSKDPNHLYLLPHKDVAVSRLVQDIVVGSLKPTDRIKPDEFNREINLSNVSYDTLFCPYSAYAIAHLYLQNYDDKKVLSFCDQGIQLLKTPNEIYSNNIKVLRNYQMSGKDLKLIWEVSDKSLKIINLFSIFNIYGYDEYISGEVDGNLYSLYILTIKNENIEKLKEEINRV